MAERVLVSSSWAFFSATTWPPSKSSFGEVGSRDVDPRRPSQLHTPETGCPCRTAGSGLVGANALAYRRSVLR